MFLLLISLWTVSDALIVPEVAIALEGDSPVFSCHKNGYSTLNCKIRFRPAGSDDLILIYSQSHEGVNPTQAAHYHVEKNDVLRTYDLIVLNVSSVHAGKYICDWGMRKDEAELIVLATSIPGCVSTPLNDAKKIKSHNAVSEVRFECVFPFHGNVLPSVEFWIETTVGRFGPIAGSSERKFNTSRTVLIQNISSDSSGIDYICQLRNTNGGLITQSNCGFQNNSESHSNLKYESSHKETILLIVYLIILFTAQLVFSIGVFSCLDFCFSRTLNVMPSRWAIFKARVSGKLFKPVKERISLILKDRQQHTNATFMNITAINLEDVKHLIITETIQITEIALLRDSIYLSGSSSDTIYVYSGTNPFIPQPSINLPTVVGIRDLSAIDIGDKLCLLFRNSFDPKVVEGTEMSHFWLYDLVSMAVILKNTKGRILKIATTVGGSILELNSSYEYNDNKAVDLRHCIGITPVRNLRKSTTAFELSKQISKPQQIAQLSNGNIIITHRGEIVKKNCEIKAILMSEINFVTGDIVRSWDSFEGMTRTKFVLPQMFTIMIDKHDNIFITDKRSCEIIVINLGSEKFRKILDSGTWSTSSEKINKKVRNIHYIPEKHLALEIRSSA